MRSKLTTLCLACVASLAFAAVAQAGECTLNVTRTACPGKEKESFSKCNGAPACDEVKKTGSAEACAKEAVKACDNVGARQKITRSKVITAKFNGAPVEGGKNFCAADRSDFNKCD
jgi:hypothetical protein